LPTKNNKEDEKKQLKKIIHSWPDNTRFKMERRKLLEEHPELMSGIPTEMRWTPKKKIIERSKWEELAKPRKQLRKPKRRLKGILYFTAFFIGILIILYYNNPEVKSYLDTLFFHLQLQ